MRAIKFRAWNGDKIVYDFLIARPQFADGLSILSDEQFAIKNYRVKEWKVMQFTGLLDKNGKEIYEGDIVKMFLSGYNIVGEIKYKQEACQYWILWKSFNENRYKELTANYGGETFDAQYCEVIGSIHENPELLK